MAATTQRETADRLLNRELSTLEYSARLLDLVADDALPLLERVKMCRFVSSNLDEFFMVRVAGLLGPAWVRSARSSRRGPRSRSPPGEAHAPSPGSSGASTAPTS
jgi:polyphosphate kinase